MTILQYCGLSDTRTINSGDTINGAVAGGIGVTLTFNKANAWKIDFTQAPYTGVAAGTTAALVALPNGEFKDVTSTAATQYNQVTYPQVTSQIQGTGTHLVTSGASPTVASGAGSTGAAIGSLGANDEAGEITCTSLASGNAANTELVGVTFAESFANPPKNVDVMGLNPASVAVAPYVPKSTITTTGFQIMGEVAAGASAALDFSYAVTG